MPARPPSTDPATTAGRPARHHVATTDTPERAHELDAGGSYLDRPVTVGLCHECERSTDAHGPGCSRGAAAGGDPLDCPACVEAGDACSFHDGWAAGWDACAMFVAGQVGGRPDGADVELAVCVLDDHPAAVALGPGWVAGGGGRR